MSPEGETVQALSCCFSHFKIRVSRLTLYLVYYINSIKSYVNKLFKKKLQCKAAIWLKCPKKIIILQFFDNSWDAFKFSPIYSMKRFRPFTVAILKLKAIEYDISYIRDVKTFLKIYSSLIRLMSFIHNNSDIWIIYT